MFIKKDLSCLSHICIALGTQCLNQAFTLSYATELHFPDVCSRFSTTLSCGKCHATSVIQKERQRAVPNHKQCFSLLLLLLLLLYCRHFYPLIWNSIGGSTDLSVSLPQVNDGITIDLRWKTQLSVCTQPTPSPRCHSAQLAAWAPLEPSSPCVKVCVCILKALEIFLMILELHQGFPFCGHFG